MIGDCEALSIEDVAWTLPMEAMPIRPEPPARDSNAAGWALLLMMVGLTLFEAWAIWRGQPTISQWVQRKTRGRHWWKAFGVVAIGLLLWHLFEGGPL